MSKNIETVRAIYEAFGRGDFPSILEKVRDDVDWEFVKKPSPAPWLVSGRGRAHVVKFFEGMKDMDFHRFEVIGVMGDGEWVTALCSVEFTYKTTGKRVVEPCEAHVWRFDPQGRIAAMTHLLDTTQHTLAAS